MNADSGQDLTISQLEQVHKLCNQFEQQLRRVNKPRIAEFVAQMPEQAHLSTLEWLIPLEMSHAWATHDETASPPPCTMLGYTKLFPQLEEPANTQLREELLVAEFRVRQELGDRPHVRDFVANYQLSSKLDSVIRQCLMQLSPTYVVLDNNLGVQLPLDRPILLGRDTAGCDAGHVNENANGYRVTVAPKSEDRVARSHAMVELVAINEVAVRAISSKAVTAINLEVEVQPMTVWLGKPPFQLNAGPCALQVQPG